MGNDTRYHLNKLWPTAIEQNNYITDMAADMGQVSFNGRNPLKNSYSIQYEMFK